MRFKRRPFSIFTLSFLDVMSCGFGAVVLLFMVLKHEAIVKEAVKTVDLDVEVRLLEGEIEDSRNAADGAARAAAERSSTSASAASNAADGAARDASALDAALAEVLERSAAARAALAAARVALTPRAAAPVTAQDVAALKQAIAKLEADKRRLLAELHARSQHVRQFAGEGNREYLTGMKMGGRRTLILLDVSASMLADTIVNVIRRRNMDDDTKRRSEKWQQAVDTVDWLTARLPPGGTYQIYLFDSTARPVLPASAGRWLATDARAELAQAVGALRQVVPAGGSNLAAALAVIRELSPQADNVFLITDGLPTQGLRGAPGGSVSGRERIRLFEAARSLVYPGTPINVILLPMEGDPMAAWAYWGLALMTHGSFLTPAYDWP
jgi:hypothetical protein